MHLVLKLSSSPCIYHDVTNAFGHRRGPTSCQYNISLGQPRVNLGPKTLSRCLGHAYGQLEKFGSSYPMAIKKQFNHCTLWWPKKFQLTKGAVIENF